VQTFLNLVDKISIVKKQLSKSDVERINQEIEQQLGIKDFFGKKDQMMLADADHKLFVLKDNLPCFFYQEGKIIPTLKLLLQRLFLKQVVVDMGAVKFVSSGADVMRPGIVEFDPLIMKEELVVVVDQQHKKPLCVAKSLFSAEELAGMKQGKVLRSVHHVGDEVWMYIP
jgi:PUA-domain protein